MNTLQDPIVIVSAARTPIGNFQGSLASLSATQLGTLSIAAAMERANISPEQVDEVLMGCVLPAGLRQAPARQAALNANIPNATPCTTINKVCGSGMKALMIAHDTLALGHTDITIAGGMESMSNAPYLLPKARAGYRLGHQRVIDHMLHDGLEDAYDAGKSMGCFAEDCAEHYRFTREQQDAFALTSLQRAQTATTDGLFGPEIVPIEIKTKQGTKSIEQDDGPHYAKPEKIPHLKPAFKPDGTVTAANSSSIADGGAALCLTRASIAESLNLTPLARILGHSSHAQAPQWFTTAPVAAVQNLLEKLNLSVEDIDLFEINEAFAVVAMAAMHDLKIPHKKMNVHGGACVLGHPIGASGARIIVTLLHALKARKLKRGVAALCIGGGEATAIGVELI